ncbi:MAG: apolipoprotein N-acyltransferase [Microbacterium sp.]
MSSTATKRGPAGSWISPLLPLRAAVPVAVVAGVALDLATPDVGWWPLTFVSVALALATLVGRSIAGALMLGLVFGGSFYALHLAWVGQFLGPLPRIALSGLETLMVGIGAIPIALAYRWTGRFHRRSMVQIFVVPLLIGGLWTVREIVMGSWPYGGFPWVRLGMTQVNGPFPEVASWIGVTGLSFLVAIVSAALVQWIRAGGTRFFLGLLPVGATAVILMGVPQFPTTDAGTFTVGWVQGNGPSGYFDDRRPGAILDAHSTATESLIGLPMDLLVWPEGSVDSDPLNESATATELDRIVTSAQAPLLANAATTRGGRTFNTSLLWTADTADPQMHDKVHPVPFGEYVPDRWLYEKLAPDLVQLIQREYTPGTTAPVMNVGPVRVGLAICFDVIFDDVIQAGAQDGAQLFVFQTNNADFRGSDENLQQLAFARMRAIETGRAVVNVSTVGTSQVISPAGEPIEMIGIDEAAAKITTLPLRTGLTPGIILGPWLSDLIIAMSLALLALAALTRHVGLTADVRRRPPKRRLAL